MEDKYKCFLTPEAVIEICNAVNSAVANGKTVTLDYPDMLSYQIVGAISIANGVSCILHYPWNWERTKEGHDIAPVIRLLKGGIIRAYYPHETSVEILHNGITEQ
jgi:hypothetical protein